METRKFRLDTSDHDAFTRLLKGFFGIVCIAVAVITAVITARGNHMTTGTAAAVVFLLLFGTWLVLAGLGLTERYLAISGDTITLKEKLLSRPGKLKASGIKMIEFSQLKVSFHINTGQIIQLRLGAYYRENSLRLMEALEDYCSAYGIATKGISQDKEEGNNEG